MAITRLSNNDLLTPARIPSVRGGNVVDTLFNAASGGTTTDVSNYNSTGQTWRVHSMTSNTTFTVTSSVQTFSVLLVGGGFNGEGANPDCCDACGRFGGGGGAGGKYILNTSATLTASAHSVTIGAGNGGNTILGSFTTASGATNGGTGGSRGPTCAGGSGGSGSVGLTSSITGTSTQYSGGGGGGGHSTSSNCSTGGGAGAAGAGNGAGSGCDCCGQGNAFAGSPGADNRGAGGGGGSVSSQQYNCCGAGGAGGTGLLIVAYRIA